MAHFAKLDDNNIVIDMLVVYDHDTADENGIEKEEIGQKFLSESIGGKWVQYSYNNRIRKQCPAIGYRYDEDGDVFVAPKPFKQWILNSNYDWEAPISEPEPIEGYHWHWNEQEEGFWESHPNDPM